MLSVLKLAASDSQNLGMIMRLPSDFDPFAISVLLSHPFPVLAFSFLPFLIYLGLNHDLIHGR